MFFALKSIQDIHESCEIGVELFYFEFKTGFFLFSDCNYWNWHSKEEENKNLPAIISYSAGTVFEKFIQTEENIIYFGLKGVKAGS